MGVEQPRWAARYAFSGEVLLGIAVLCAAYRLLDLRNPLAAASARDGATGSAPPAIDTSGGAATGAGLARAR